MNETIELKYKAVLFDMDGVIINSENVWSKYELDFLSTLEGVKLSADFEKRLLGSSLNQIYDMLIECGLQLSKDEFMKKYDILANKVYFESKLTPQIENLFIFLQENDYKLGLVSASRLGWIELVLAKLAKNPFQVVVSVQDSPNLKSKPEPDGYIFAMQKLKVESKESIIIEDSNSGLKSGLKSGAFVIAFSENLLPEYKQIEVNKNLKNVSELLYFFDNFK